MTNDARWRARPSPTIFYRLYHVENGHFAYFEEFDAPDDDIATEIARAWILDEPAELWAQSRLVATFNGGKRGP